MFNTLLLLLSHFSRVQLCATPQTAAPQAPPPLGFSRQEHWSGLPFPSPMHERKSESEVTQVCPTLSDPMDCSLPGSSVHGIFQARVLEWGAIAFSYMLFQSRFWKWNNPINILLQRNRSYINSRSFVLYRKQQLKHYHAHTYTSIVRSSKLASTEMRIQNRKPITGNIPGKPEKRAQRFVPM